jgi:DNA-binding transcriptional LysR family regulator
MENRQMKYILKVAEEKSFSKAAKKLYITQPSLSQYILHAEQQLGVQLFDRTTIPLQLTFAGECYVETAKRILDLQVRLSQKIDDIVNLKKGRLTIGSSPFRSTYLLPRIIPLFKKKFPGIEIILAEGMTTELEELTLDGTTDLSLLLLPLSSDLFSYEPIFKEEIVVALPPHHPLSETLKNKDPQNRMDQRINLNQLQNESFILVTHGQRLHQTTIDLCTKAGFKPRIIVESQSMEAVQSLVSAGLGVALLPDTLIGRIHMPESPCYFSLQDPIPTRTVIIGYRKGRYLSNAAQAFIDLVKEINWSNSV